MTRAMVVIGCMIVMACGGGPTGATASESASAGEASGSNDPQGAGTTIATAVSVGMTESGGAPESGGETDSEGGTGSVLPTGSAGEVTGEPEGGSTTGVVATTGASNGSTTDGPADPPAGSTTAANDPCIPLECNGKVFACGDCIDNDGDGKVDTADPECVSPCDDREDIFATDIPGDNNDPCKQDCFFDGNSGQGGGDCQWNLKCDKAGPGSDECPYDEQWAEDEMKCPSSQGEACLMACQAPNGCDCFGCCTVVVDGKAQDVFLGDNDCSLDAIEDCAACTKSKDCVNECDPKACEVCFPNGGELPPDCVEPTCPVGVQACKVDNDGVSNCPEGKYCSTGCCFDIAP